MHTVWRLLPVTVALQLFVFVSVVENWFDHRETLSDCWWPRSTPRQAARARLRLNAEGRAVVYDQVQLGIPEDVWFICPAAAKDSPPDQRKTHFLLLLSDVSAVVCVKSVETIDPSSRTDSPSSSAQTDGQDLFQKLILLSQLPPGSKQTASGEESSWNVYSAECLLQDPIRVNWNYFKITATVKQHILHLIFLCTSLKKILFQYKYICQHSVFFKHISRKFPKYAELFQFTGRFLSWGNIVFYQLGIFTVAFRALHRVHILYEALKTAHEECWVTVTVQLMNPRQVKSSLTCVSFY